MGDGEPPIVAESVNAHILQVQVWPAVVVNELDGGARDGDVRVWLDLDVAQNPLRRIDTRQDGRDELAFRLRPGIRVRINEIIGQQALERGRVTLGDGRVDSNVYFPKVRLH